MEAAYLKIVKAVMESLQSLSETDGRDLLLTSGGGKSVNLGK